MINNRPDPIPGPGGEVDMNALSKHFASKNSPDNTIRRIEALELAVHDLTKKGAGIEADR